MAGRATVLLVTVCVVVGALSVLQPLVSAAPPVCCETGFNCPSAQICCDPEVNGAYPCSADYGKGYCRDKCS